MQLTPKSLTAQRKRIGLSQMALASAAKMGRFNISLFESGHRKLTDAEKSKITNALSKKMKGTRNGNSNAKK